MRVAPLYCFIQNHLDALRAKGFQIEESRRSRETFFIHLDPGYAYLIKALTPPTWEFIEQHISIEKYDDASNSMIGSHFSFTHRHARDKTLIAKTHVFLDRNLKQNGCYQQKVIRQALDGTEEILFNEYYSHEQRKSTHNYPGVFFTIKDLNQIASVCMSHLINLKQEKAQKYMELNEASKQLEERITLILQYREPGYLDEAKQGLDELKSMIIELNAYNLGKKNVIDRPISYIIATLEQQELMQKQVECVSLIQGNVEQKQDNQLTIVQESTPSKIDSCIEKRLQSQQQIILLIDEILKYEKALPDQSMQFYQTISTLKTALIEFEFSYPKIEIQDFLMEQKSRFNPNYFDLILFVEEKARLGDVEGLDCLFKLVENDYDFIPLFSKLLYIIDEWHNDTECLHLSRSIHYFYKNSELFRSFVQFKLHSLEYQISHDLYINHLPKLYDSNKLKAFNLYLELGGSPEGKHARVGRIAYNALQAILLLSASGTVPIEPYIQSLFEHGAVSSLSKMYLIGDGSFAVNRDVNQGIEKQQANLFSHHYSTTAKKDKKSVKITKLNSSLGTEHIDFHTLSVKENILAFGIALFQLSHPEKIAVIAKYMDLKASLNEFCKMLSSSDFMLAFIPSTKGGVIIEESKAQIRRIHHDEFINFSDNDNITTYTIEADASSVFDFFSVEKRQVFMAAEKKTMLTSVYLNPEHLTNKKCPDLGKQNLIRSLKNLYAEIEPKILLLSNQEKQDLLKEFISASIRKRILGEPSLEQICGYTAAIIIHSLMNIFSTDDYVMLLKLFKQYSSLIDEKYGRSIGVFKSIEHNFLYLCTVGYLHPGIQSELKSKLSPEFQNIKDQLLDKKMLTGTSSFKL